VSGLSCVTQTSPQPWSHAFTQLPAGTPHDPHGAPSTVHVGSAMVVVVTGTVRVEVELEVEVDVETVEEVVPAAQPPVVQASQQLEKAPTHAVPPLGGRHLAAPLATIEHRVAPLLLVRQHVTARVCRTWSARRTP
jgi:hypothetical protein